jgi:hypothetical protein
MDASPSNQAPQDSVLPEALAMVQPLVTWLIRSGVGYNEFAAALKPVFLAQAKEELARGQGKATDSAISLLSGLHRKDVRAFRESAKATQKQVQADGTAWGKPSPANQVITRWLSLSDAPECLPFSGPVASFEQLAASVSKDFHPRALLDEMLRLGLVWEDEQGVHLLRDAFVPSADLKEARQLMAGSVSDHLQAAVHNLTGPGEHKFLEQSVFADGLSAESVHALNLLANTLWSQVLQQMVAAATPLCNQDAQTAQPHRFRLGLFSYAAPEVPAPNAENSE